MKPVNKRTGDLVSGAAWRSRASGRRASFRKLGVCVVRRVGGRLPPFWEGRTLRTLSTFAPYLRQRRVCLRLKGSLESPALGTTPVTPVHVPLGTAWPRGHPLSVSVLLSHDGLVGTMPWRRKRKKVRGSRMISLKVSGPAATCPGCVGTEGAWPVPTAREAGSPAPPHAHHHPAKMDEGEDRPGGGRAVAATVTSQTTVLRHPPGVSL